MAQNYLEYIKMAYMNSLLWLYRGYNMGKMVTVKIVLLLLIAVNWQCLLLLVD